jgi:hypothetical protein
MQFVCAPLRYREGIGRRSERLGAACYRDHDLAVEQREALDVIGQPSRNADQLACN